MGLLLWPYRETGMNGLGHYPWWAFCIKNHGCHKKIIDKNMKMFNKIQKKWDKENEEIKALPRLLITIASIFLAVIIASIFMAATGSFMGGGLAIIISYLIFKKLFEKLARKIKK